MTEQYAVITVDHKLVHNPNDNSLLFTANQCEAFSGTDHNIVTVETLGKDHYRLDLTCYYDSDGKFTLEITNTLEVALYVFAAALVKDAELN